MCVTDLVLNFQDICVLPEMSLLAETEQINSLSLIRYVIFRVRSGLTQELKAYLRLMNVWYTEEYI